MAIGDFTNQNIQDTYKRVVQTDSSNRLADGTGSFFIPVSSSHAITASHALFAVSASHEITFEVSSSYAQTASISDKLNIASDGANRVIIADGDGTVTAASSFTYDGAILSIETQRTDLTAASSGFNLIGHITASKNLTVGGNISASGNILGDQYKTKGQTLGLYHEGSSTIRLADSSEKTEIYGTNIELKAPVTASSDISASGTIIADVYRINDKAAIGHNVSTGLITLAASDQKTEIDGTNITLDAPVTASIISASGNLTANFPDTNVDAFHYPLVSTGQNGTIQSQNSLKINPSTSAMEIGSLRTFGNITASTGTALGANISASGDIFANSFRSKDQIVGLYHKGSSTIRLADDTEKTKIHGTNIFLNAPVTASIISASGVSIFSEIRSDQKYLANGSTVINNDGVTTFFGTTNKTEIDGTNITLDAPVTASIISASRSILTENANIDGNLDVDGTTNLDVVDIDGTITIANDTKIQGEHTSGTVKDIAYISTGNRLFLGGTSIGTTVQASNANLILDSGNNVTINADSGLVEFREASTTSTISFNTTAGHITASGNISASTLEADQLHISPSSATQLAVQNSLTGSEFSLFVGSGSANTQALIYSDTGHSTLQMRSNASNNAQITFNEDGTARYIIGSKGTDDSFQIRNSSFMTGGDQLLKLEFDGSGITLGHDTGFHVTASGDISASGLIHGSSFIGNGRIYPGYNVSINHFLDKTTTTNPILRAVGGFNVVGNVTASGIISASDNITAPTFMSKGKVIGLYHSGSDTVRISSQTAKTRIDGTNIKLDAPITASSNISASGKIITSVVDPLGGNLLTLGDIDGSNAGVRIELNQSTNKVEVKNADLVVGVADSNHQSLFVTSDITASGDISSSGNIKASTFTAIGNVDFDGDLDVDGTANLDDVDIDGNVDLDGNLTMGENNSGHTLSVFGNSTGVNMTFNVSNNDMLKLGDNTILGVGGGNNAATSDLEIVHNGTDSIINNKTGNLIISASVTERIEFVGNITASGNISASGDLRVAAASDKSTIINSNGIHYNINGNGNGTNFRVDDTNMRVAISTVEFEVVANKIELGSGTNHHVTASGNISSSGAIISPSYQFGNRKFANASTVDSNGIELGNTGDGNLLLTHLTASGNISASGQIQSADIITNRIIAGDNNTIVATTGTNSLTFNTPITASGNISSSADVLCKNLTVDDGGGGGISFKDSPGSLDLGHISYIEGGVRITATDVNPAGTGHLVVSSSGGTGTSNVLVGIGTETPGEMLTVMGNISASGNIITDKITAHAPFSSDSLLNLHDDNVVNANGVTLSSIGSMVFMLDSNDTGTVDKIEFRADSQDASAGNLLATIEDNGDFAAEGNITASGNISSSGTLIVQKNQFSKTTTTDANHQGDVVFFGGTTSMTAGKIYYYNSSGNWAETDADAESTAKGLLAVALGTASDTNGMLLRGTVTLNHDPGGVGDVLYLSTTAGQASSTVPSGNGDIVRVIGYCLDASNGQIWFNPDNTFVEVSA